MRTFKISEPKYLVAELLKAYKKSLEALERIKSGRHRRHKFIPGPNVFDCKYNRAHAKWTKKFSQCVARLKKSGVKYGDV